MQRHPAPGLAFLAAAGAPGSQQPQQHRVAASSRGIHLLRVLLCQGPAAAASSAPAASSSASSSAAYSARLQPQPAMLLPPDRASALLRPAKGDAGLAKGDAATHAAVLLAAAYNAVQGHHRAPPPDEQLDEPVRRGVEVLYGGLLRAEASEQLQHACTKVALLMHPPGPAPVGHAVPAAAG